MCCHHTASFLQNIQVRIPWFTCDDEVWSVFCEFIVRSIFFNVVIVLYLMQCIFIFDNVITMMSYEHHGISNHWQSSCLFNSLFMLTTKKKYCATQALLNGDSPHKGPVMQKEFPCHNFIMVILRLNSIPMYNESQTFDIYFILEVIFWVPCPHYQRLVCGWGIHMERLSLNRPGSRPHFTHHFYAHNPNILKIHIPFKWKITNRSSHKFAHVMTAELSWHVQICDLIRLLQRKLKQEQCLQDLNYELLKYL